MEENLIKKTCKELGLTYRELGEAIGLSEGRIKQLAISTEVTEQVVRSIEMLREIQALKTELEETNTLKTILKNFVK